MTTIYPGPVLTLEARYGVPARWFDMTCDVYGMSFRRGRSSGGPSSWQTPVPTGSLTVELDNSTGRYSSFDQDGNVALGEGTMLRLRCFWQGKHHVLFTGEVEQWSEKWTEVTDRVVVTAIDGMGQLAEQGGAFQWVPGKAGQTVRARLEQLLNRAGVRGEPFYSHQGSVRLISPKVERQTVTEEITLSALSDFGVFFHEPYQPANIASATEHMNSWVYLDRGRFREVAAAQGALVPTVPVRTAVADWRAVPGPDDRTVGAITRPAQGAVPVFTDACLEVGNNESGYRDIEWAYIAYERPSLVAVSNALPPEERDANGNLLPKPWTQFSAQVPVTSSRHKIVELTDLRYSTQAEANALASAIATQLGRPKLEVSRLRLWPHREPEVFAKLLALRLQDHVVAVRNLVHGESGVRIEVMSLLDGINIDLNPRPSWGQGEHVAEWDVTLVLSPINANIEDVPVLPPTVPDDPGIDLDLASEGQSIAPGLSPTGYSSPTRIRASYSTSGGEATRVYVEAENVLTLVRQRLNYTSRQGTVAMAGGLTGITDAFNAEALLAGATYRIRVVSTRDDDDRSDWVTVSWPLPTPAKPSIVNLAAWQKAPYAATAGTATATSITWTARPGVTYQLGIKKNHNSDTNYAAEAAQSGNVWSGSLDNDTNYSIAVRYISGGQVSAWSPPLKVSTGHPARVTASALKLLASASNLNVAHNGNFTCTVPLISPPANGSGDGQWTITSKTYDPAYAGRNDGFVGTLVSELRVRAENVSNTGARVGSFLCVPSYAVVVSYVTYGIVWDPANNKIPTTVPNPSWGGANASRGYWRAPYSLPISNKDTSTRNGVVGLRPVGYAYITVPMRMKGSIEAWGRTYTPVPRLSNKVVP